MDALQGRWQHSSANLGMLVVRGDAVKFDCGLALRLTVQLNGEIDLDGWHASPHRSSAEEIVWTKGDDACCSWYLEDDADGGENGTPEVDVRNIIHGKRQRCAVDYRALDRELNRAELAQTRALHSDASGGGEDSDASPRAPQAEERRAPREWSQQHAEKAAEAVELFKRWMLSTRTPRHEELMRRRGVLSTTLPVHTTGVGRTAIERELRLYGARIAHREQGLVVSVDAAARLQFQRRHAELWQAAPPAESAQPLRHAVPAPPATNGVGPGRDSIGRGSTVGTARLKQSHLGTAANGTAHVDPALEVSHTSPPAKDAPQPKRRRRLRAIANSDGSDNEAGNAMPSTTATSAGMASALPSTVPAACPAVIGEATPSGHTGAVVAPSTTANGTALPAEEDAVPAAWAEAWAEAASAVGVAAAIASPVGTTAAQVAAAADTPTAPTQSPPVPSGVTQEPAKTSAAAATTTPAVPASTPEALAAAEACTEAGGAFKATAATASGIEAAGGHAACGAQAPLSSGAAEASPCSAAAEAPAGMASGTEATGGNSTCGAPAPLSSGATEPSPLSAAAAAQAPAEPASDIEAASGHGACGAQAPLSSGVAEASPCSAAAAAEGPAETASGTEAACGNSTCGDPTPLSSGVTEPSSLSTAAATKVPAETASGNGACGAQAPLSSGTTEASPRSLQEAQALLEANPSASVAANLLAYLAQQPVDAALLEGTKVGATVNRLKKQYLKKNNTALADAAGKLVEDWRKVWQQRRREVAQT